LHPILLKLGFFNLPTYGVLLASGLLAAIYTVTRLGKREGLDTGRLVDFCVWLILVGLAGAKILMFITDPAYLAHPSQIFTWETFQSAGVFYGGFIAACLFAAWYVRVYKLPFWRVFDVYAPAIALGQSFGRMGCFSAGCDYGKATHSFPGVVFTDPISSVPAQLLGVRLYPTQLFESAATFAIFGILLWWYARKKRDGDIFLLYITLYAIARFGLEFLRGDEDRGFVFHHLLSTSQFIAILAIVVALLILALARRPVAGEAVTAPVTNVPGARPIGGGRKRQKVEKPAAAISAAKR